MEAIYLYHLEQELAFWKTYVNSRPESIICLLKHWIHCCNYSVCFQMGRVKQCPVNFQIAGGKKRSGLKSYSYLGLFTMTPPGISVQIQCGFCLWVLFSFKAWSHVAQAMYPRKRWIPCLLPLPPKCGGFRHSTMPPGYSSEVHPVLMECPLLGGRIECHHFHL